nr:hypothetical protein [Tanacetum cinerariifolium]
MQNFISSSDLLCWNIILNGNNAKSMTTDKDGNLKIRPPVTAEEHQQARFGRNAESKKMQKSLLKQKFKEFKISEEEGLDKGYDKMQKILSQMNTLKIKPKLEGVNIKFLSGLPPSWRLTPKGIHQVLPPFQMLLLLVLLDQVKENSLTRNQEMMAMVAILPLSASLGSSSSNGFSKSKCSVIDDVVYSFFANHEIDQQLIYEDLDQMNKEEFEEYDLKHQMEMLSIKVHRFEKKHGRKIKFNGRENVRFDKKLVKCFNCKKMGHFSRECRAQGGQNSNNYQKYKEARKDGTDSKVMVVVDGNADLEGEVVSADDVILVVISVSAGPVVAAAADSPHSEIEFSFMGNYMPPSNILDIDELQMVYGKKATNSFEIKTNDDSISLFHDSVLFYFSDRQEDFPSVYTSSIETDVKSSNTLCNKFGSFNKESHFRKHKSVTSKSCYVCGSYLHLIKDCNFHEQTFTKRNAEGKGILKSRPTGKPVNPNRPKPVSVGRPKPVSAGRPNPISAGRPNPISAVQPNPVSAGQPNTVSAGDGILGLGPLNIQSKSTYFHSFTHNNQQIFFPITHNSLYSLYLAGGLNGKSVVTPSAGWPWTNYGMSKTKGSKINCRSKSKSWSFDKGPLGRPKSEMTWAKDKGIVDSGCSRNMSGNKDKLEDFEDFHGGEVTFRGSTGKITGKGSIKTKNLNFENVLYVEEL